MGCSRRLEKNRGIGVQDGTNVKQSKRLDVQPKERSKKIKQ